MVGIKFESAADNYLYVMESLYRGSKGQVNAFTGHDDDEGLQRSVRASRLRWALLRNARVFEVDHNLWALFYHLSDRFTNTACGGVWTYPSYDVREHEKPENKKKGAELMAWLDEEGKYMPYLERLPFESVYLAHALEQRITFSNLQNLFRFPAAIAQEFADTNTVVSLLGTLITPTLCIEFMNVYQERLNGHSISMVAQYAEGRWLLPRSLAPWYLKALCEYLTDHTTEEVPVNSDLRRKFKKSRAKQRTPIAPMPYYRVHMRRSLIESIETEKNRNGRTMSYRHDVRAHEMCRIRRGEHPIDPEERKKYTERGYILYEGSDPSAEDARRLAVRGQRPKGPTEWLAMRTTWKQAHVSPKDPKLVYVPSTHVPQNPIKAE